MSSRRRTTSAILSTALLLLSSSYTIANIATPGAIENEDEKVNSAADHRTLNTNIIDIIPENDIRRTTNPLEQFHINVDKYDDALLLHTTKSRKLAAEVGSKRWIQKQQRQGNPITNITMVQQRSDSDSFDDGGTGGSPGQEHVTRQGCRLRPDRCGCAREKLSDYRGTLSTTISGHTCKAWTIEDDEWGIDESHNYCRNPQMVARQPFCFVEQTPGNNGVLWDYCNVRECRDDSLLAAQTSPPTPPPTPPPVFIFTPTPPAPTTPRPTPPPVNPSSSTVVLNAGTTASGPGCVDIPTYEEISIKIENILDSITDPQAKSHMIGGPLRLAAHDFMDFCKDCNDNMGADGCINWNHPANAGLETMWNDNSALFLLHQQYQRSHGISRADFWILATGAVVKYSSVNHALDMKETYYWGRRDRTTSCTANGERMPNSVGCQVVEATFLDRMDLTWTDAVALLGAHTVGLAHADFSGHDGMWVPNHDAAHIFDKKYYENLVSRAWTPHVAPNPTLTDWQAGNNPSSKHMMLNTDICFFYDIDEGGEDCCTRTDLRKPNGQSRCLKFANRQCDRIRDGHPRFEAAEAVIRNLGGQTTNANNAPWYKAFEEAWFKATMNGHSNLQPMPDRCV